MIRSDDRKTSSKALLKSIIHHEWFIEKLSEVFEKEGPNILKNVLYLYYEFSGNKYSTHYSKDILKTEFNVLI